MAPGTVAPCEGTLVGPEALGHLLAAVHALEASEAELEAERRLRAADADEARAVLAAEVRRREAAERAARDCADAAEPGLPWWVPAGLGLVVGAGLVGLAVAL